MVHIAAGRDQFYKTKLCPHLSTNSCRKGEDCYYAHSNDELRDTPDLRKTRLCETFQKKGSCANGANCYFAHYERELRYTNRYLKTDLCKYWRLGHCESGELCRHAHGVDELRPRKFAEDEIERLNSGNDVHNLLLLRKAKFGEQHTRITGSETPNLLRKIAESEENRERCKLKNRKSSSLADNGHFKKSTDPENTEKQHGASMLAHYPPAPDGPCNPRNGMSLPHRKESKTPMVHLTCNATNRGPQISEIYPEEPANYSTEEMPISAVSPPYAHMLNLSLAYNAASSAALYSSQFQPVYPLALSNGSYITLRNTAAFPHPAFAHSNAMTGGNETVSVHNRNKNVSSKCVPMDAPLMNFSGNSALIPFCSASPYDQPLPSDNCNTPSPYKSMAHFYNTAGAISSPAIKNSLAPPNAPRHEVLMHPPFYSPSGNANLNNGSALMLPYYSNTFLPHGFFVQSHYEDLQAKGKLSELAGVYPLYNESAIDFANPSNPHKFKRSDIQKPNPLNNNEMLHNENAKSSYKINRSQNHLLPSKPHGTFAAIPTARHFQENVGTVQSQNLDLHEKRMTPDLPIDTHHSKEPIKDLICAEEICQTETAFVSDCKKSRSAAKPRKSFSVPKNLNSIQDNSLSLYKEPENCDKMNKSYASKLISDEAEDTNKLDDTAGEITTFGIFMDSSDMEILNNEATHQEEIFSTVEKENEDFLEVPKCMDSFASDIHNQKWLKFINQKLSNGLENFISNQYSD